VPLLAVAGPPKLYLRCCVETNAPGLPASQAMMVVLPYWGGKRIQVAHPPIAKASDIIGATFFPSKSGQGLGCQFQLTPTAAKMMANDTRANFGRELVVICNGQVFFSPGSTRCWNAENLLSLKRLTPS